MKKVTNAQMAEVILEKMADEQIKKYLLLPDLENLGESITLEVQKVEG